LEPINAFLAGFTYIQETTTTATKKMIYDNNDAKNTEQNE